jgi:hypothetical protein
LKAGDATKSAKDISYDEKRQRVTLDFGEKINYSGEATLEIKFEGTINNARWTIPCDPEEEVLTADEGHGRFLPLQVYTQG